MKLLLCALVVLALLPSTEAAQTPAPDERAAAQAFAGAAKRLVDAADAVDEYPSWFEGCRALRREPPDRHDEAATAFLDGLLVRDLIDKLKPAVQQARSDLANAHTADPVLISGRAAVRHIGRALAAFPAGEADPCAAYEAFVRAGYPRGPVREARALERRLDGLATRGTVRKIVAAADRMIELGVSREDAEAFRSLVT